MNKLDLEKTLDLGILKELGKEGLAREYARKKAIKHILRDEGAQIDDEDCILRYKAKHRIKDDKQFHDYLAKNWMNEEDAIEHASMDIKISAYAMREFGAKARVVFAKERSGMTRVVYGLMRTRSRGLAEEVFLRAENGESQLEELAATFSEGPERETKGLVGPIPLKNVNPQLASKLMSTKAGILIPPFRLEKLWTVARLEKTYEAVLDEKTHERICRKLFEMTVERLLDELAKT